MDYAFLNQELWGNPILTYFYSLGIILLAITFNKFFSKLLTKLFFTIFKRKGREAHAELFLALLKRPTGLLITVMLLYLAIIQLRYPLNEEIYRHKTIVNGQSVVNIITLIELIDKVFVFSVVLSLSQIALKITDYIKRTFNVNHRANAEKQIFIFFIQTTKIAIVVIGVLVALKLVFELNVSTIIAGLGIGGIAIALAAKETIENLFGSLTIFIDKPFIVGDTIKMGAIEGMVERVGFRSTQIKTVDKTIITLPNKKMIDGTLENFANRDFRRTRFTVPISNSAPLDSLSQIIQKVNDYINSLESTNQAAITYLESFAEGAFVLEVGYFIKAQTPQEEDAQIRENVMLKIIHLTREYGCNFK